GGEQLLSNLNLAWQESEDTNDAGSRGAAAAPGGERQAGGGPRAAVGSSGGLAASGLGISPSNCDLFVGRVRGSVDAWVRERRQLTATTLQHLYQTGVVLAGLPGTKTIVYLSDGLEPEPVAPVSAAFAALCPGQSLELPAADMSLDFVALTRHLNANQVLIHALQAS